MGDIIEQNQTPEPSEASQVDAFGADKQSFSAAAVEVPSYTPRQTFGQILRGDLGFIPVIITLAIVVIYFAIVTGGVFLYQENISNLVGPQIGAVAILGLGSILVLLLGEIDLSVASVSVLCAVIMAILSERSGARSEEHT